MKRLIAIILLLVLALSIVSCSYEDEETINIELVNKYTTTDQYYINTYKDTQIQDFGIKYNVPLYDVEETDYSVRFFYVFEGKPDYEQGIEAYRLYREYLDKTFGLDEVEEKLSGTYAYHVADNQFIKATHFNMSSSDTYMIVIEVPIKGYVPTESDLVSAAARG